MRHNTEAVNYVKLFNYWDNQFSNTVYK